MTPTEERLRKALEEAMAVIKVFHGPIAWDIYEQNAPEMKRFREALSLPAAPAETDEATVERVARAICPSWWSDLMPNGEHPLNNYPGQHKHYREQSLVEARAAIAALPSASPWRDIKDAPKDGTMILIFQGSEIAIARWKDEGWRNNHYGTREPYWYYHEVTHWQPLPSPPSNETR